MRVAAVSLLLSLVHVVCAFGQNARTQPEVRASQYETLVAIRSSSEEVSRGDRMQVWFSTRENVFVTVFRIDTDGRIRMLYPERPWHNNYSQAGRERAVRNPACDSAACSFVIDDYPGLGYIFAVASKEPFDFSAYSNGEYWDYSRIAHSGRVTGDPYAAVSKLMERLIPESSAHESSYDVRVYHVERVFEYPRFLCYECHRFVRFSAWDPYQEECPRFQLVRNDSPTVPPAERYGPTRVIFSTPMVVEPQFVFEERRSSDSGVTAEALGGVGTVPAPLGRRRSTPENVLTRLIDPKLPVPKMSDPSLGADTTLRRPKPRLVRRKKARPDTSTGNTTRTRPSTRDLTTRGAVTTPANPVRRTPVTGPRTGTGRVRVKPDTSGVRTRRAQSGF